MSLLSIIRRTQETPIELVDLIKLRYKESRVREPIGEDDWVRVSSVGGMCQREEVLCSKYNITREEVIDGDSGVNFEHGHAIHWMFQSKILPKIGVIIGSWRCTFCGEKYGDRENGMVPRPERCFRCGAIADDPPRSNGRPDTSVNANAFVFAEEWLGNEKYKIGGSPDGQMILDYHPGYKKEDLILLEFKSTNDRNFYKYKDAPDFVHVIQTQLYMWLTGYKRAKIIYFNKNARGTAGMKEHDLEYDPECIERVLDAIQSIRTGVATGAVPPRVICSAPDCQRAFGCKVKDKCFSEA